MPSTALKTWGFLLVATAATAWSVSRAVALAWLSDDSFISFRYAQNLILGNGLVFNAGERVEGYTNLLWTLLIAGAMALGISPEAAAAVAGIAFWLLLVGALAWRSWRQGGGQRFTPLAASLVLLMPDFQTWATGGLETSMFAFLSVAGVLLACRPDAERSHMLLAGLLLAAAVATRPDGVIFAAVGVGAAWFLRVDLPLRRRFALTLALGLPLGLAGAALVAFKLRYYGDLFPTAFYSKSALDPYYGQGFVYVYLFLEKNWFILPLVVILAVLVGRRRLGTMGGAGLVFLTAFGGFTAYVVHSGGDFMFARRLLPALPFLFIVLEDMLRSLSSRPVQGAVLACVVVGACFPYPVYGNGPQFIRGIANEPAFYSRSFVEMRKAQARAAAEALAGLPVRAAFEGGMCMFAYYSGLPYLAELHGLTQYSLAKKPLATRGRVGHEKTVDDEWLTANDIHLIFQQWEPPIRPSEPRNADEIYFGEMLQARIWIYSDAIMDRLRGNPAVDFVPIEMTLVAAQQQIDRASYEDAQGTYAFLERFYFRAAGPDKQRLADALTVQVAARQRAALNR